MRNQTLYQSFRDLCLKGFDLLSQQRGSIIDIYTLPEYNSFLQNVEQDQEFSKHFRTEILVGTFLESWNLSQFFVPSILGKIIENKQYDEALVEGVYADLEKLVYSDTILTKVIIPLNNFDCQSDCIRLEEGVSIRRITDEEKGILKKYSETEGGDITNIIYSRELESWKYVIELRLNTKILINMREQGLSAQSSDQFAYDRIVPLLTFLRIFEKGTVGCRLFIARNELKNLPYSLEKFDIEITRARTWNPEKYLIKENKVLELQQFYSDIKTVQFGIKYHPLDIAIRRFNYSYERRRPEDNFIDCAISMEALFSSDGTDSLTHKLKVRCARLIAVDLAERQKISGKVGKFYSIRSKIVHGGKTFEKTDGETLQEIQNYLGCSIRKAIEKRTYRRYEQ